MCSESTAENRAQNRPESGFGISLKPVLCVLYSVL